MIGLLFTSRLRDGIGHLLQALRHKIYFCHHTPPSNFKNLFMAKVLSYSRIVEVIQFK